MPRTPPRQKRRSPGKPPGGPARKTARPPRALRTERPERTERPARTERPPRSERNDAKGPARRDESGPAAHKPRNKAAPPSDRSARPGANRRQEPSPKRTAPAKPAPVKSGPARAAGAPAPRPRRRASGRPAETMRIAKAMARAGLCSRRDAERWIADGRVKVNGETITSPALDVTPKDRVLVDGAPLPDAEATQLWRYAKPRGLVTTHRDPEGRPTVFENLPDDMPRVVSIGRLDVNTEGLLLLTTDGELARYLELPATGWLRRYRVRAHVKPGHNLTQADLDALKDGVTIEGIHYGPIEATLDSRQGMNVWITIGLREGKNREVRKILSSFDLDVNRLIRVSFGPFQLLDLKPGTVERVRRKTLIDQLGPRLASQFNLTADEDDTAPPSSRPKPPQRRSASRREQRPARKPPSRK
jgi:23S rRNA pseudouridine2605 synthase